MTRMGKMVVLSVVLFAASGANAQQVFDHLKCYKVKDLRGQNNVHFTLTLTPNTPPFAAEVGCQVQAAARNLCIPVAKSSVSPPPFPSQPGATAQVYVCYNMRCPREDNVNFTVTDQLGGTGPLLVKRHSGKRQLCVPVGATTTTTSITTTTSSSTTSSTVSASPSFAFDSEMYFGSGLF